MMVSANALSYESPLVPNEATTPASARRSVYRIDRYKSSLIDADNYLLKCQRYIELNPVRAAMITDTAHYEWSSYRCHALGVPNRYLSPYPRYLALGT